MASSRTKFLAVDWETSGLRDETSPSYAYIDGPQGLQIGAAVLDPDYNEIEAFTSKMRFIGLHDGVDYDTDRYGYGYDLTWSEEAERIHGMSPRDLISEPHPRDVARDFAAFLRRHYAPGERIIIVGHNPDLDRYHTRQLLYFGGLIGEFKFHHRMIDTYTLGWLVFDCDNSDDLFFKVTGEVRNKHDALWDALAAATVLRKAVASIRKQ